MTPNEHHKRRLYSWTPVTTKLLSQGGYNILDHVIPDPFTIHKELHDNGWMDRLRPARTQADNAQLESLMGSFMGSSMPTVRGDKSCFLSQHHADFAKAHPQLHALLSSLEMTIRDSGLLMEFSHTSVQLAVYPGDGMSGYIRHCDRTGNRCRGETSTAASTKHERVISCIYYLTPNDWTEEDGGHLRLFTNDNEYYDVLPHANRMVVFRSDRVEHQVLPSLKRNRMALTIWIYGALWPTSVDEPTTAAEDPGISVPRMMESSGPPPLSVPDQHDSASSIFVAIASYRDSETGPTIQALLQTAQYPHRIVIGLCLQIDPLQDADILQSIPKSNIRILQLHAKDAAGPCYARALCQHLMQGDEDYYLQIDSHMRFRRNWDTYLIHTLPAGDKTMLTTYPVGYQLPNKIPNEMRGTILVPWKIDTAGMLRQRGRLFEKCGSAPIRCYLYAAGFNFSKTLSVKDVPYDVTLRHVFFGEELSMAARLFTSGWDLYAPPESVVYHLWSRSHRPVVQFNEKAKRESTLRLIKELQSLAYDGDRIMKDFWRALKVDVHTQTLELGAENGELKPGDFCDNATMVTPEDPGMLVERKVPLLDAKSQSLIASFLREM
jgi:[Skp1-protein]-hydroxyproline N-acetylglucosaminyltransferase